MAPTLKVDLNCDLGESFGRYSLGEDARIMPLITSANVACGFHAGDPIVMAKTVSLAKHYQVGLGAHPGYPDLQGFGRRQMAMTSQEIASMIIYQIGALDGFARAAGLRLVHIKPHGALYNLASQDAAIAKTIAQAVYQYDSSLILVGLAGSALINAGQSFGLRVVNEGFPDRAYLPNGQLMPRSQADAVLTEPDRIAENALRLVSDGIIMDGNKVTIDTLCLHGDHPRAVENAHAVRTALVGADVEICSLGQLY